MSKRNILLMLATVLLCSSCIEIPNDTVKEYISNTDIVYFYIFIIGLFLNDEFRLHGWGVYTLDFDERVAYYCGFAVSPFGGYLMATYTHFLEDEVISYIIGYIVVLCIIYWLVYWYLHKLEDEIPGGYSMHWDSIANFVTYVLIALGAYHIYTLIASYFSA